jgi:phosphoribosyl 1,2-cyclic phosphodiesterase
VQANLQFSPLLHLEYSYGVQQLDGVVITHPHRDHIDDIGNFDALSPRVLLRPKHLTDAEVLGGNRRQTVRLWSNTCVSAPGITSQ